MRLMRSVLIALLLLATACQVKAQDDPEYRMEIGGGLALAAYEGDFNGSILKGWQPRLAICSRI